MVTNLKKNLHLSHNPIIQPVNLPNDRVILSHNPIIQPVNLPNDQVILSAENNEHLYLGMWFTTSTGSTHQIKCNFSHRVFNIVKFYNWLEINEVTL